jgi:hypothetical protein
MRTFFFNLKFFHHRVMMRFLKKRGWVVFYLEPQFRTKCCEDKNCWFSLYIKGENSKS